jgi:hypothetical protein
VAVDGRTALGLVTLKLSGHKVDADTKYGIWWSWHKKARRGIS